MIALTLIIAAVVIVVGGIALYNSGYDAGYSAGLDQGFSDAGGVTLAPLETHHMSENADRFFRPGGAEEYRRTREGREFSAEVDELMAERGQA